MKAEPVNECSLRGEELTAYLLGELAGSAADSVRRHVESCGACRKRMRELQMTLDLAREALTDPALASDIADELWRDRRERVLRSPRRGGLLQVLESRWLIPAAAAAAILIGWTVHLWRFGGRSAVEIRAVEVVDSGKPSADSLSESTPPAPIAMDDEMQLAAMPGQPPSAESLPLAAHREADAGGVVIEPPALAAARPGVGAAVGAYGGGAAQMNRAAPAEAPAAAALALAESMERRAEGKSAGAAPAFLSAEEEAAKAGPATAERLARIRVPAFPLEGLTARAAVERLKALVAAAPGKQGFEIALVEAPTRGPVMLTRRASREFRKDATEALESPAEQEPPVMRKVTPAIEETATITLTEAVRRLAEHYGLRYRVTERGVEFFEPEAVPPP